MDPLLEVKECTGAASPYQATNELVQALAPAGETHTVECGERLFSFGEEANGVYLIMKGTARASLPGAAGRELVFRTAGPGAVLGLPSALCSKSYQFDVEALESLDTLFLHTKSVNEILQKEPGLCMQVMNMICNELETLKQTTEHMRKCDKKSCSLYGACCQPST